MDEAEEVRDLGLGVGGLDDVVDMGVDLGVGTGVVEVDGVVASDLGGLGKSWCTSSSPIYLVIVNLGRLCCPGETYFRISSYLPLRRSIPVPA